MMTGYSAAPLGGPSSVHLLRVVSLFAGKPCGRLKRRLDALPSVRSGNSTMKKLAGVMALFLFAEATATAQTVRQFARPAVPSTEILDQFNLKLSWRVYLPTGGLRDGLYS